MKTELFLIALIFALIGAAIVHGVITQPKPVIEKNTVWIVEVTVAGKWEPTVGIAFDEAQAREELRTWKRMNRRDQFQYKKYTAE